MAKETFLDLSMHESSSPIRGSKALNIMKGLTIRIPSPSKKTEEKNLRNAKNLEEVLLSTKYSNASDCIYDRQLEIVSPRKVRHSRD